MAPTIAEAGRSVTPYLLLSIFLATLGPLQFGYRLAELNAPQDVLTCRKKTITALAIRNLRNWVTSKKPTPPPTSYSSLPLLPECIPMSDTAFATISSIFTLGGLIGALAAGPLASRNGRLPAMRATSLCFLLGGFLEAIAWNVPVLAVGRLIAGAGAGASTVIVPLYISEISPPNDRGFFGTMTQVSINVGVLGTQTLGYFLSYGGVWRWVLVIGTLLAVVHAAGLVVLPESPAWLAAHGKVSQARRTLQRIRGKGFDIGAEAVAWGEVGEGTIAAEQEGLLSQSAEPTSPTTSGPKGSKSTHLGFVGVVRDPDSRPAIIAVVGIMFAQQFCGINSIIMYSVSLLANLLPISSGLLTIIISIVNVIATLAASPLPDRLGRKTCLLISVIGQGTSSLLLALSIRSGTKPLSAVSVVLFVAFFAVGLGPVPFMMASELVGQEAVGATQSWSLGSNYAATFIVAQFFPLVNKSLNDAFGGAGWVYFLFAACAVVSACFISWWVPETKGKSDADEVWGRTRRLD